MELPTLNLKELEMIAIKQALDKYKNLDKNYIKTVAKELGIGRNSLYRKLNVYHINDYLLRSQNLKRSIVSKILETDENQNGI